MKSAPVPRLKDLGLLVQKPQYKTIGNWYVRHIIRDAALPVTWLLLHTSVTANQITAFSLVMGVAGIVLLAGSSVFSFFVGILLVQGWYLLDHVDGQVARYRKTASLSGRFFDFITHHIIHSLLFFSLGFYVYEQTDSVMILLWGYVTSLSIVMFNLINDTKYKTFFEALLKAKNIRIADAASHSKTHEHRDASLSRKLFAWIHKASEIHVVMNLMTLAAFVQFIFLAWADFRWPFFIFYGFAVPALTATKTIYLIKKRKIDAEYEALFNIVE